MPPGPQSVSPSLSPSLSPRFSVISLHGRGCSPGSLLPPRGVQGKFSVRISWGPSPTSLPPPHVAPSALSPPSPSPAFWGGAAASDFLEEPRNLSSLEVDRAAGGRSQPVSDGCVAPQTYLGACCRWAAPCLLQIQGRASRMPSLSWASLMWTRMPIPCLIPLLCQLEKSGQLSVFNCATAGERPRAPSCLRLHPHFVQRGPPAALLIPQAVGKAG